MAHNATILLNASVHVMSPGPFQGPQGRGRGGNGLDGTEGGRGEAYEVVERVGGKGAYKREEVGSSGVEWP